MDDRRRPLIRIFTVLLLAAQAVNVAPALAAAPAVSLAATAASGSGLVTRAQGLYRDARYDEAVGLLAGPILRKELAGQELIEARLVLARCYVKKGILPRAKEHFGAILAIDPAFTLDRTRVEADELAVFNEVKGVSAAPAKPASAPAKDTPPVTKPATPAKPATPPAKEPPPVVAPAQPQLHKPEVGTAGAPKESWLKRNKFLAIGLVVGGGVAVGLAAGGGGGGGGTPPGPTTLPGFPSVPSRP